MIGTNVFACLLAQQSSNIRLQAMNACYNHQAIHGKRSPVQQFLLHNQLLHVLSKP